MRYLDISDFLEIERMTLYEYDLRMTAAALKRLDQEYYIHLQSWANQQAQATKEVGSGKNKKTVSIYKNFNDFFNHEKLEKKLMGTEETKVKDMQLSKLLLKSNS